MATQANERADQAKIKQWVKISFWNLAWFQSSPTLGKQPGPAATAQGKEESAFWARSPQLTIVVFLTHRGSPAIAATWSKWHGVVIAWKDNATGKLLKLLNSAFSEQLCHRHFWGSSKWFLSLYATVSCFWDDGHHSIASLQTFSVSLFQQDSWLSNFTKLSKWSTLKRWLTFPKLIAHKGEQSRWHLASWAV